MIKPLMGDPARRYTGVWRSLDPLEGPWIREIFGPYLVREVTDLRHEFMGDHVLLFETFANAQDPRYFNKFRGLDAFLVDLSDEHYEFVPEMYTNFRGVIRLRPEELDALQSDCIAWWQACKASSRDGLGEFLNRRSEVLAQPTLEQLFKPRHAWPGFAHLELLRHHDLRALGRRVRKMTKRLATTGGMRVHHRPVDR